MRKANRKKLVQVLEVTASNIRSLGPNGTFGGIPFAPYQVWLRVVEEAIETAKHGK